MNLPCATRPALGPRLFALNIGVLADHIDQRP
jgi:hypothetical protein